MITRHLTITIDKHRLESIDDPKYMAHIYSQVAHDFAEELAKHIEPKEIIDNDNGPYSIMDRTVVLHFEITGGSLPDHEGNT